MTFEDVTVHVTLLGGGFGRKSKPDFAIEAALLSKAMGGAPVKLHVDPRGRYPARLSTTPSRPSASRPGSTRHGKPVAGGTAASPRASCRSSRPTRSMRRPFELGMGLVDVPFDIPNLRCENGEAEAHARIGWFRSVSNIPHAFAIQSFAAEMAHAAGKDQKDYLLELMGRPASPS